MKTLIIITGPTASGKTELAIQLAQKLNIPVISADSRQIYKDIPIGTAAPSPEELAAVPHYFIGTKKLDEYFSAWEFETGAIDILKNVFEFSDVALACGGSMMYIDALVNGLDEIPTITNAVREEITKQYHEKGLSFLLDELKSKDLAYYNLVDKHNHKRIIHALEIIRQSGVTYSSLRTNSAKKREFRIISFYIDWPRDILFERIGLRVDNMLTHGLEEEAMACYHLKHLNSLNTVGYKELFAMFGGEMTRNNAIDKIKRNTRVFAKKQLTWLKKKPDVIALRPGNNYVDTILTRLAISDSLIP